MHHLCRPGSAGPVGPLGQSGQGMGHTICAGICGCGVCQRGARPPQWFGGCTSKHVVEQKQRRSVRIRRLQRDEGPHHEVLLEPSRFSQSNGEKRLR